MLSRAGRTGATESPSSSSVGCATGAKVVVPRPGPWEGVVVVPGSDVGGGLNRMDLSYAWRKVTSGGGEFAGRHSRKGNGNVVSGGGSLN